MTGNTLDRNGLGDSDMGLSMTNLDPNYTAESLASNMLEDIVQSTGNTSLITANFENDKTIDAIFLGYHNLSVINFVFKDSASAVIATKSIAFPSPNHREYITSMNNVRYVEITIFSSTIVFVGNISLATYTDIPNVVLPMRVSHPNTTLFDQTEGAQFLFRSGVSLKEFDVNCKGTTQNAFDAFVAAFNRVSLGQTWWMDRFEETTSRDPIFGAFTAGYTDSEVNTLVDFNFPFKEAR